MLRESGRPDESVERVKNENVDEENFHSLMLNIVYS